MNRTSLTIQLCLVLFSCIQLAGAKECGGGGSKLDKEKNDPTLSIIGAFVSIIGSVCSNLGVNMQKFAFMKETKRLENNPDLVTRSYYRMPLWVFGLALVILGSLGDFTALGLAAQSIVAPIGAVTLIANVFFAHFWLKEPLAKKDLIGTTCILLGSVLAVSFGDHNEKSYTVDDLLSYYSRPEFLAYTIICIVTILSLYFIAARADPIKRELEQTILSYDKAEKDKDLARATELDKKLIELEDAYSKYAKTHPFALCAISGIFGGQNILFGKMVAEMLGSTFQGNSQMGHWATWVFILAMFTCIFTQLHFLAKALEYFDALYVVPVFQCFFITVSTLAGAAYFGEFDCFGVVQGVMFPIGIGMTLGGVKILSMRDMVSDHDAAYRKKHLEDIAQDKKNEAGGKRRSIYAANKKLGSVTLGQPPVARLSVRQQDALKTAHRKSNMFSPFAALNYVDVQKLERSQSHSRAIIEEDDVELTLDAGPENVSQMQSVPSEVLAAIEDEDELELVAPRRSSGVKSPMSDQSVSKDAAVTKDLGDTETEP